MNCDHNVPIIIKGTWKKTSLQIIENESQSFKESLQKTFNALLVRHSNFTDQ